MAAITEVPEFGNTFSRKEVASIYCGGAGERDERFIVSLVAGYGPDDVGSPAEAALAALDLTRDEGSSGTHWFVFGRVTGQMHLFEQCEFEQGDDPNGDDPNGDDQ
jgi:hypothetical protein